MQYRVGVIIDGEHRQSLEVEPLVSLLREIRDRTAEVRSGNSISLLSFIETNEELSLADAVVASENASQTGNDFHVLTSNGSGLSFWPRATLEGVDGGHGLGLIRGVGAILSVSHVLLVLCSSGTDFDRIETWFHSFENTWALVALVASDKSYRFLDVNPNVAKIDSADWLACVKKRWQTARPDIQSLPSPKAAILGLAFPWLATAIIKRRFETVKKKTKSQVERCRGGMGISNVASEKLHREDKELLDRTLKTLCPFFTRHDDLGKYYANIFRTTCLLVPVLIGASTVLAVTAVVDLKHHDVWHIVEAILLVLAAWLFLKSQISKQHAKWVEHRLTTEFM